jgi:Ca-activated chloride channel family protein
MTKGKKAILFSQDLAQQHFIKGGNNILFLASDGEFRFTPEDQKVWDERQSKGPIIISTVAFGDDKTAHKTLKQIAEKGGGSFISISKRKDASEKLLQEVEMRSRPAEDPSPHRSTGR